MRLTDEEFIRGFEACTLDEFHHRDHIRVASIYLQNYPYAEAERRMADGLKAFATSKGAAQKYHETMTRAWMRLVASVILDNPARCFDDLVTAHPELLDQATLNRFYSRDRLASADARIGWVEADLQPIPAPGTGTWHLAPEPGT